MEIVETEFNPKQHIWLKWMGVQEPPLEADSWVPIVRDLADLDPDPSHTVVSPVGAELVKRLAAAGIDAAQRAYRFDESYTLSYGGMGGLAGSMETHAAVLVHERDHARALPVAVQFNQELEAVSDAELTKEALEAGPPEED